MSPLFAFLGDVDPWIFAFSFITVVVTIWMGFRSARTSKTTSDFFVAGRAVSVGWNASAISASATARAKPAASLGRTARTFSTPARSRPAAIEPHMPRRHWAMMVVPW